MTTLTVDTQAKQSPGVRELSLREVEQVSGGFDFMDFSIAWGSTVTGAAIGLTVGGPAGSLVGAGVGLTQGVIGAWAYDAASR